MSPEARARIGAAHRGKVVSAETRAKLSAASKGKTKPPVSAETRVKMSIAQLVRVRPEMRPRAGETRPHATVARYVAGCRCELCREASSVYNRSNWKKHAASSVDKKRLRSYGLRRDQFDDMLLLQDHCCAICRVGLDRSTFSRRPQVDHDHKTGKVRAVLCGPCNRGLGLFRDDPALLDKAAAYLRSHAGHKET